MNYDLQKKILKQIRLDVVNINYSNKELIFGKKENLISFVGKFIVAANNERYIKKIDSIRFSPGISFLGADNSTLETSSFERGKKELLAIIESISSEISLLELIEREVNNNDVEDIKIESEVLKNKSKRIFIVHGRDESMKLTVKDFIREIGLDPIILHDQLDKGQTVIEKFLSESKEVDFAIVLFSPDDEGKLKDSLEEFKSRARQNVILEYGFFVGVLGRENTFALIKNDIELPSDMSGLLYCGYEDEWKIKLLRTLKSKGYDVDANVLLR